MMVLSIPSYAQVVELSLSIESVRIDSSYTLVGNVLETSIRVSSDSVLIPNDSWKYHAETRTWRAISSSLQGRSVVISYSTSAFFYPRRFSSSKFVIAPYDSTIVGSDSVTTILTSRITRADLFGSSTIQRSGSLTRGITFGSNRDASLESGLRLDLSVKITDDLEILATLTDQSTPIQPDGSTQNLREFDQVFIRLRGKAGQLQLGDVDVVHNTSMFARVNRRLQGADILARTTIGDQRATASVARGVFRSQVLGGIDGVQGPYRLTGGSGETFIIVLAGSETVYIDGIKVERGEENDYIIDYGLGEITFTNKRFITAKTRITIDFQYITQEYTRTLLAGSSQVNGLLGGRLDLLATVIREADGDNPNAQLLLTQQEINILRQAGDDPNAAVVSGVTPYDSAAESLQIRYIKRDTLVAQPTAQVYYKASNDPNQQGFSIRFSRTEDGRGGYIRSGSTLNGFVYRWVGDGAGNYDTLRTLIAPTDKQVASLASRIILTDGLQLVGELAGSRFDKNRFSDFDNSDNGGLAWSAGVIANNKISGRGRLRFDADHRYTGERFVFFDRPREVEFDRQWNVSESINSYEQLTKATVNWQVLNATAITLNGGALRRRSTESDQIRFQVLSTETDLPEVNYQAEITSSSDSTLQSEGVWFRQRGTLLRPTKVGNLVLTPIVRFEHEERDQNDMATDSLSLLSLSFLDVTPGLQLRDSGQRWSLSLSSGVRTDNTPRGGSLQRESISRTHSVGWMYDAGFRFRTEQEIGLRSIRYDPSHSQLTGSTNSNSLQVRSLVRYMLSSRFLEGQWTYDIRSERRAQLQERYFEVGPELGSYIWDDIDGDGIQDIDEFFPERVPGEGTFLLQFVPGDTFIPVTSLDTGLRHTLRFKELFDESDDWLLLQRVEISSRFTIRESSGSNLTDLYQLRIGTFQGANTQQGRISTNHEFRLLQGVNRLGLRLSHDYLKASNRLVIGLDRQNREAVHLNVDTKIDDIWSGNLQMIRYTQQNESEQLASRGFNILSDEVRPSITVRFSRQFITSISTGIINRSDRLPAQPTILRAWFIDAEATLFHSRGARTRLSVGRRVNAIRGLSSSYGLYELTDGGAEGTVWSATIQSDYRISDFIRASFNYDMKSFPGRPLIQTMRFVVSAVL